MSELCDVDGLVPNLSPAAGYQVEVAAAAPRKEGGEPTPKSAGRDGDRTPKSGGKDGEKEGGVRVGVGGARGVGGHERVKQTANVTKDKSKGSARQEIEEEEKRCVRCVRCGVLVGGLR